MSDAINRRNQRSYQAIAGAYAGDEAAEDDPEMRAACRALFVERLPGRRVLEVGCGPGTDARALADAGLELTATDAVKAFCEIAARRHPGLQVRRMDMTRPDLPPESFDGIYAFASFLHLPRELAATTLAGLFRLLVPQGSLFLALIRSDRLREYTIEDWGGVADNPVLFTCYDPPEIEGLLRQAGFDHIEQFEVRSELYERLPRLVERGVTGYQVVARRLVPIDGRCFCGGVRFVVRPPTEFLSHCHCEACRLSHAAPFVTWTSVPIERFEITAGAELTRRHRSASGADWSFCGACGSSMLYEIDSAPDRIYVAAGSLVGPLDRMAQAHVSYEERVRWYEPRDHLPRWRGKGQELLPGEP